MIRTTSASLVLQWCALVSVALPLACSATSDGGSAGGSGSTGHTGGSGQNSAGSTSTAGTNGIAGFPGTGGSISYGGALGNGGAGGYVATAGSAGVSSVGGAIGNGGSSSNGGSSTNGGSSSLGGSSSNGGSIGVSGSTGNGGSSAGGSTATGCDASGLTWKTANKTNFTSYPDPGSEECIKYNGCAYEGLFAACDNQESKAWVQSHNIVSVFPDLKTLKLHDLCLKAGSKSLVVTVLDECADSDCDGCCTQNRGSADELIDVESYTDQRFGVDDGPIQWADLGKTKTGGCN